MRWMLLLGVTLFMTACGTVTRTQVIEYRDVVVAPPVEEVTFIEAEPVDVTSTTVYYY